MRQNQVMLTKNEAAWKGKVRIVGISIDAEKEPAKQWVTKKGWNKIQHLILLGWKADHPLIKDFSVGEIPFVCLVDKFGKINYTGHPSLISLQECINSLVAEEKEDEPEIIAPSISA